MAALSKIAVTTTYLAHLRAVEVLSLVYAECILLESQVYIDR